MFSLKQQVYLQLGVALLVVFFLALIGGLDLGAALVWSLVAGLSFLLLRRQTIIVDGGDDIARGLGDIPRVSKETQWLPDKVDGLLDTSESTNEPSEPEDVEASQSEPAPQQDDVEERKPETLDAPRNGAPDDLKQILGIGPKLEELLNDLGVYHYSQIAQWDAAEVAWIDDAVPGFKGRASRDEWVRQARELLS